MRVALELVVVNGLAHKPDNIFNDAKGGYIFDDLRSVAKFARKFVTVLSKSK